MNSSTPGFFVLHYLPDLLKLLSIESVMPSNHLILCCSLLLLLSIFPSLRVFSDELMLHIRWPKYWRFSFQPVNEYSGLISFTFDWFDLAVHGTLKSLLQLHSSFEKSFHFKGSHYVSTANKPNDHVEPPCLQTDKEVVTILVCLFI